MTARDDVASARWPLLDLARGVAVIAMIAYHFAFDLVHFGWLAASPYDDWRWIASRSAILSSFLLVSGMSLILAHGRGETPRRFWLRELRIGAAAVLVSIGSWIVFRDRFIWFGVLHAIVVMSALMLPLRSLRGWLIVVGAAVIAAGVSIRMPLFDHPLLQWVGMMTTKPATEDYVPLLPWFGVMLVGGGFMSLLLGSSRSGSVLRRDGAVAGPAAIRWLGRHSLLVYLVHQPLIFGAMTLVAAMVRAA